MLLLALVLVSLFRILDESKSMQHSSFVDIRPSVESFANYKGEAFDKLVPYEVAFTTPPNGALRISIPVARKLAFIAFSRNGVQVSRKGTTHYIRVFGNTTVPSHTVPEEKSLHWFATQVTYACVDIWRAMSRYVLSNMGLDKKVTPKLRVIIQAGLPGLQDSFEINWSYASTFFLHSEYTRLYRHDDELDESRPTDIDSLTKTSDSFFRLETYIKTFDFQHYPLDDIITINVPFINLSAITHIEAPVKFGVPNQDDEKAKERVKEMNNEIRNFKMKVLDPATEKKSKKVDSILDSQPAPPNPQEKAEKASDSFVRFTPNSLGKRRKQADENSSDDDERPKKK